MPNIASKELYRLFARSAQIVFQNFGYRQVAMNLEAGTPLYRYVTYRSQMPQVALAALTQFRTLATDTDNRWTGVDPDGGGRQGLYFSAEFLHTGDPFPELTHYQTGSGGDSPSMISYYRYEVNSAPARTPEVQVTQAANLRSMFLFTLENPMPGLDLRLRIGAEINPLLQQIYEVSKADPDFETLRVQTQGIDLNNIEAFYNNPNGAEFCRAVGNVALAEADTKFLLVSSVRDPNARNIVIRTDVRGPDGATPVLEGLRPEGRATFFVDDAGNVGKGCFTVSDLIYNATFETDSGAALGLPKRQEVVDLLTEEQKTAIDELAQKLTELIETLPASDHLDRIAAGVEDVKRLTTNGTPTDIATALGDLHIQIRDARNAGLHDQVLRDILDLSEGVAGSMEAMNNAVRAAHDVDPEPPEVTDDPDQSESDTKLEERAEVHE